MSHLRSRFRSTSPSVRFGKKNSFLATKMDQSIRYMPQNTTTSSIFDIPAHKQRPNTSEQKAYNSNVHRFKQIFNSNDPSQLPFMASLRRHRLNKEPPRNTVSEAFDVAAKMTCNQMARKKISDFKCAQRKLSTVHFKWHNRSGRNNLWSTQYGCSLRNYGNSPEQQRQQQYDYDSLIRPIVYKDVQERVYDKSEMVCERHRRSFSMK